MVHGGKTWLALVALYEAGPSRALYETDVWHRWKDSRSGTWWSASLKRLVELGFAERDGRRGGYCYTITAAGQGYVLSEGGPGAVRRGAAAS